jgi:hypothetical protein
MAKTLSWDANDDEEINFVTAGDCWTLRNRGRNLCGGKACLLLRENIIAFSF